MRTRFTQGEVERLIRGATKAGVSVGRVELSDTGAIAIVATSADHHSSSSLDAELEAWRRSNGSH